MTDLIIINVQKEDTEGFAKEQWLINNKRFNFLPQRLFIAVYNFWQKL